MLDADTAYRARGDTAGWRSARPAPVRTGTRQVDAAILVYDLRGSGVVRNALRIAGVARARGLNAELWVVRRAGALSAEAAGIPVRTLADGDARLARTADSLLHIPALVRTIRAARPGILFSSGNHMHAFACAAHRLAGMPDTRLVARASNALAAASQPKRGGMAARLMRRAATLLERVQFRMMDEVVAVSRELAADLAHHAGIAPGRLTVVPNGVDLAAIARAASTPLPDPFAPWFAPGRPPVIVGLGRLSRQKDFAALLRAFAAARAARPLRLVIIGDGPVRERARLLALAETLGVAGDVRLAGYQPNPHAFLSRAALFVLSSRWEGASNALIEALACGCPVVATACPTGVREVLAGQACGTLVPVGDVPAMAEAMLARLGLPPDRAASRRRAEAFGLTAMLDGYARQLRAPDAHARAA